MPPVSDYDPAEPFDISVREETESAFSRDDDDEIIRRQAATREQFSKPVTITIDGETVEVMEATPATDFLGNILLDKDQLPIARSTTIFDAAVKHWKENKEELARRIPILCHREHLNPIAVCRLCSVLALKPGRPGRKLVPACQHLVEPGMDVTTQHRVDANGNLTPEAQKVREAVSVLTQLLTTDHLRPDAQIDARYTNELGAIAESIDGQAGGAGMRKLQLPPPPQPRNRQLHPRSREPELDVVFAKAGEPPYSSPSILVDHDKCVMCDRCVRSCTDVKQFRIIGHTGKGYETRIAFDLDLPMKDSSCTQCGECATACPTGALVFRRRVSPTGWDELQGELGIDRVYDEDTGTSHSFVSKDFAVGLPATLLDAGEMSELTLQTPTGPWRVFQDIPYSYLKWNEGAVRRREVRAGEILCEKDDYASTAYLLDSAHPATFRITGVPYEIGADALILGELACLSGKPRNSTIEVASPGVIYEVRRNLLDMTRRTKEGRERLDTIYRRRAADDCLRNSRVFARLTDEERRPLLDVAQIRRCEPGDRIVSEGELAFDFYIVRLGFAEVTRSIEGRETSLGVLGAGEHFGVIGLFSEHPLVQQEIQGVFEGSRRTSSVTARDRMEVLHIPGSEFLAFLAQVEHDQIVEELAQECVSLLRKNSANQTLVEKQIQTDSVRLGLHQGQKLLVLDLERCTRCDECTRGCADSHPALPVKVSRLLREGLRFGKYLVATCCRSCHTPYCLDGCPVDAIHRKGKNLEVVIENHCIGCSLCERNCPYGAIQMAPLNPKAGREGQRTAMVGQKAFNCDLCQGLVPKGTDPFCVRACPHDAAFRWEGAELVSAVRAQNGLPEPKVPS